MIVEFYSQFFCLINTLWQCRRENPQLIYGRVSPRAQLLDYFKEEEGITEFISANPSLEKAGERGEEGKTKF